jgi:hypothetical protein
MAKNLFDRYIWLVDTIYQAGKITFEEINECWLRNDLSEGKEIPLRTFHNQRTAIEDICKLYLCIIRRKKRKGPTIIRFSVIFFPLLSISGRKFYRMAMK